MKELTIEEMQSILNTTGLTKNAIEKKFKMGQGSIGKFLKGNLKSLPEKYVGKIRKLAELPVAVKTQDVIDIKCDIPNEGIIPEVKFLEEPIIVDDIPLVKTTKVNYKRPLIDKDLLP